MSNTVRIIPSIPTASGRRRGWIKLVTGINRQASGGYAIEGDWLAEHEMDLPVGAVVVRCSPAGSVKNGYKEYDFGILTAEGKIQWDSKDYTSKNWLTFLDDLEKFCAEHNWSLGEAAAQEKPTVEEVVAPQQFFDDLRAALSRLAVPGIELDDPVFRNHPALVFPETEVTSRSWANKVQIGSRKFRLTPQEGFSFLCLGDLFEVDGPGVKTYYSAVSQDKVFYFYSESDPQLSPSVNRDEIVYLSARLIPEFVMAKAAKRLGLSMPEPTAEELLDAVSEEE
jgi:hypothetical protein